MVQSACYSLENVPREWLSTFSELLADRGVIGWAAEQASLKHSLVTEYPINAFHIAQWREQSEEFDRHCRTMIEIAADRLEAEAIRRGRDGYLKPVWGKGEGRDAGTEKIGEEQAYSDILLMFTLKGHRPDKFGDRTRLELGAAPAGRDQARDALAEKLALLVERRGTQLALPPAIDAEVVNMPAISSDAAASDDDADPT